jgi:RNA polymerase sigma factor (sigma-70 family)
MTDTDIIEQLKDPLQHERVFGFILKTYKERIYYHIRKIVINHDDADDVTQEAFIKIWRNLDKYRGESKLFTWLYRIATNEALSFIQRKKDKLNLSIDDESSFLLDHHASGSETTLLDEEAIQQKLEKALVNLTEKQRVIFNLKYFENLKYEEIAEITETSVGGLKALYHLAVKKIEDFFDKN